MPPARTAFWNNFVNTIQMPPNSFRCPHGRLWRNSETLTSLKSTSSYRNTILISILLQGFLRTCSVPSSSPWSSRSLLIQNGLLTSRRTISMPSSPAFLWAILREQALFTISSLGSDFPMITTSHPKCILKRKNLKSQRKKGKKRRLSKNHR